MKISAIKFITALTIILMLSAVARTQTSVFLYQGRLNDGGTPANGNYEMQFKLFDALAGGTQIGATQTNASVPVSAGVFSVSLDFGANAFPGAQRYLEVAVRPAGNPNPHTVLAPRTQILTGPYSIRSNTTATADTATNATTAATATNALNLGGVAANQFVQTNDVRLSDARNPLPNSANYIQNTTNQQAASNFNVSGNGTVGSLNANGAFSVGGVAAPATAPAGQGRIFFDSGTNKFRISENGGAFVNLVGSNGVSGAGTPNSIPLWSAGTTLGNSAITQLGSNIGIGTAAPFHRLGLGGGPAWTTHAWGGLLDLENASAIGWRANAGGTRFGMGHTTDGFFMFRTVSELGTTSSIPIYDLKMDNGGNIGIGSVALNSDVSQARLNIFNFSLGYGFVNSLGAITVGSYVDATGGGYGTRSNHPLNFFTNNNAGSPQMTLGTNGNFGIGVTSPSAKLSVSTTANGSANNTAYFEATNIGPNVSNIHFGTTGDWFIRSANSTGKVILQDTGGNVGIGTSTPAVKLTVEGSVSQGGSFGGLVKAMAYISDTGTIVRCFNGVTNLSPALNCGITVSHTLTGRYVVNLGFPVVSRYIIVQAHGFEGTQFYGAGLGNANATEVYITDFTNALREDDFTIIIF